MRYQRKWITAPAIGNSDKKRKTMIKKSTINNRKPGNIM